MKIYFWTRKYRRGWIYIIFMSTQFLQIILIGQKPVSRDISELPDGIVDFRREEWGSDRLKADKLPIQNPTWRDTVWLCWWFSNWQVFGYSKAEFLPLGTSLCGPGSSFPATRVSRVLFDRGFRPAASYLDHSGLCSFDGARRDVKVHSQPEKDFSSLNFLSILSLPSPASSMLTNLLTSKYYWAWLGKKRIDLPRYDWASKEK